MCFVSAFGQDEGLHPPRVQALRFLKVTDVEPVLRTFASLRDLEVVPLQMSLRVTIHLYEQIILEWTDPDRTI